MIESFSAALMMKTALGGGLSFVGFVLAFVLGMAVWIKLSEVLAPKREGLRRATSAASFVVIVLGASVAYLVWISSFSHGEVTRALVGEHHGERVVQLHTTWTSGKGGARHSGVKTLTMSGQLKGSARTSDSPLHKGIKPLASIRGALLVQRHESLLLIDPVTYEVRVKVSAVLDERLGRGSYRLERVEAPHLVLMLKDGRLERFDLSDVWPEAWPQDQLDQLVPIVGEGLCQVEHRRQGRHDRGSELAKTWLGSSPAFLRPRVIHRGGSLGHACEYEVGGQTLRLVLHRSTAFGEEGQQLLSALSASAGPDAKPLWTTPLDAALGRWGVSRFALYSPHLSEDGAQLCLWLLRERVSLSLLCLDHATGRLDSARVLF